MKPGPSHGTNCYRDNLHLASLPSLPSFYSLLLSLCHPGRDCEFTLCETLCWTLHPRLLGRWVLKQPWCWSHQHSCHGWVGSVRRIGCFQLHTHLPSSEELTHSNALRHPALQPTLRGKWCSSVTANGSGHPQPSLRLGLCWFWRKAL